MRLAESIIVLTAAVPGALANSVTIQWNSQYTSSDTVRVWADLTIDPGIDFAGFASSVFDVLGDDEAHSQSLSFNESLGLGRYFQFQGASAGTLVGDDILAIDEFQLPGAFNPQVDTSTTLENFFAFEYRITDFTPRTVSYTSRHLNMDMYNSESGGNVPYALNVSGTSFDIAIVPLPSGAAMAGVGVGLVCLTTRRSGRLR